MSGPVANNIFRSSGVIAAAAGGLSWQPVVTASTLSASAGNGYWINTTSNACTITLPGSAEAGDQIIFVDYARTWGTNAIIIDSNGLNYQGQPDTFTVDYDTSGQALNLVYSGATIGWTPSSDIVNALEPVAPRTQRAIFGFGNINSSVVGMSNLVNSSGVVGNDVTAVGTARKQLTAATYGGDKAFFTYGRLHNEDNSAITNLVSNSGVVASNSSAAGTVRWSPMTAAFGSSGQAIIAFGYSNAYSNLSNIVSNSGVISSDVSGVGDARRDGAGVGYGVGLALCAFGYDGSYLNVKNLVNNVGVVGADVSGVGTAGSGLAASTYGSSGQAVIAFGYRGGNTNTRNLVNSSGVIASDVSGAGTARQEMSAANYGADKGIFAYGGSQLNISNLVSTTGVISADVTGVGTGRRQLAAAGYSYSA